MMAFTPFVDTDLPSMANFNQKFLDAIQQATDDALGEAPKIATGSYVGTGKYGSRNPNSLTFGFEPKIIIIGNDRGGVYINFYFWGAVRMNGANNYAKENIVSTSNYTISWYHPSDVDGQLNASGITYNYIAIG